MNMQTQYAYSTITRQPAVRQFLANDLIPAILCIGGLTAAGIDGMFLGNLLFWFSLAVTLCLLYRLCYLRTTRYTVTAEQIIYEHGVFHRSRDYMELYRVIDFKEDSTLVQQMLGLKTVRIFSGDRSTPRLDMTGIISDDNIIPVIRERVTSNRRKHGIYEISNR